MASREAISATGAKPAAGRGQGIKSSSASNYASTVATQTDVAKYRGKYKELKNMVREIETENDQIQLKTLNLKRTIQRMRLERAILYERLEASQVAVAAEAAGAGAAEAQASTSAAALAADEDDGDEEDDEVASRLDETLAEDETSERSASKVASTAGRLSAATEDMDVDEVTAPSAESLPVTAAGAATSSALTSVREGNGMKITLRRGGFAAIPSTSSPSSTVPGAEATSFGEGR